MQQAIFKVGIENPGIYNDDCAIFLSNLLRNKHLVRHQYS